MEKQVQNIQDIFLNSVRKDKAVVTIYLAHPARAQAPKAGPETVKTARRSSGLNRAGSPA